MAARFPGKFQWRLGRRFVIGVPYAWLLVFFVLPFLILVRISVTDMGNGVDPFGPLVAHIAGAWHIMLKPQNYLSIFSEPGSSFGSTI
ncbi:MAG: transporter permease subunit, partial [Polaromonas sp.]|nr:transporter permease subunit [Polaromonas sp.]